MLEERKRNDFWAAKVSEQTNARGTWRVINNILCRDEPQTSSTTLLYSFRHFEQTSIFSIFLLNIGPIEEILIIALWNLQHSSVFNLVCASYCHCH